MSETATLTVNGMKCGGCENSVISKLSELAGIESVKASHKDNQVVVDYYPAIIDLDKIEDAIAAAGYTVE